MADTVAEGTTPWGHFVAEQVGVVYVLGFTNSTDIFVLGQIEGKPVELYVTTMSSLTEFVTPPGTYTPALSSSSVWGHVYGLDTNEVCSSEPLDWITVTIQAHQGPAGSAAPGTPVELTGSLALDGDGWDLQIPFAIRGVCDKLTSI